MDKLTELMQERASIVKKMRKVIDKADEESRALKAEEKSKIERMENDIDDLEERINTEKRARELEKKSIMEDQKKPEGKNDTRDIFRKYLREGRSRLSAEEKRAMTTGDDSKGGYIVPTEFHDDIIDKLEEANVMRQLATVSTTSSEKKIPIGDDSGKAYWLDEGANFTEDDIEFGQKTVDAHKAGTIIKVSEELLYDNDYDLENYIQVRYVRRIANLEEEGFITGNGTGKPTGFLQDALVGKTAAGTDAITSNEIIDLYHAVPRAYRTNGTWLFNDTTIGAVRKLKDGNDNYLWQPGLQASEPDQILGAPIEASTAMPELEADKEVAAFGDFSFYEIFDRRGMVMQRLVEKYADEGKVGFRAYQRTDGVLLIPEAIQVLKTDDGN